MKKFKQISAILLALGVVCSMMAPAGAAADPMNRISDHAGTTRSVLVVEDDGTSVQEHIMNDVTPYTYNSVKDYINNANFDMVIDIYGIPVHYYYGDNYTVYEKQGNYFIIQYNQDYSNVSINGMPLEVNVNYTIMPSAIKNASNMSIGLMDASSDWTYMYTDLWTVSVGGLLVDVAIGMIPTVGVPAWIISQIASYLLGEAVNGILPTNFAITVRDDWYYKDIDPWMGTIDYTHDWSAWAGTKNDPLQDHIAGDYYSGDIILRIS